MKIEMNKQYRTRDGHAVRLLCTDRNQPDYPVVGLVSRFNEETMECWTVDGKYQHGDVDRDSDLVEVGPYDDFKIDEPVMVHMLGEHKWHRAHFAGVDAAGAPKVYELGKTQWSSNGESFCWTYCRRPTEDELKVK